MAQKVLAALMVVALVAGALQVLFILGRAIYRSSRRSEDSEAIVEQDVPFEDGRTQKSRASRALDQQARLPNPPRPTTVDLQRLSPVAADTARLLAVVAPDPIPELIVGRLLGHLAEETDDAEPQEVLEELQHQEFGVRGSLRAGGVANGGAAGEPGSDELVLDVFLMHPEVQTKIRSTLAKGEEGQWVSMAAEVLATLLPDPPSEPLGWPEWEVFFPHALHVAEAHRSLPVEQRGESFAWLCDQVALYLMARERPEEAEPFACQAVDTDRRPLHLGHLAEVFRALERYPEAIALWREARDRTLELPEIEPLDVANANGFLATALADGEEFAEAETLYREALGTFEREHEEDTPQIGLVLSALSWTIQEQGRLQEAERLKEEALAIFENTLPGDSEILALEREELAELRERVWKEGR